VGQFLVIKGMLSAMAHLGLMLGLVSGPVVLGRQVLEGVPSPHSPTVAVSNCRLFVSPSGIDSPVRPPQLVASNPAPIISIAVEFIVNVSVYSSRRLA
jgi:hypothetical protein